MQKAKAMLLPSMSARVLRTRKRRPLSLRLALQLRTQGNEVPVSKNQSAGEIAWESASLQANSRCASQVRVEGGMRRACAMPKDSPLSLVAAGKGTPLRPLPYSSPI